MRAAPIAKVLPALHIVNLCEVDGCGTVELLGEAVHGNMRIGILNGLNRRLLKIVLIIFSFSIR